MACGAIAEQNRDYGNISRIYRRDAEAVILDPNPMPARLYRLMVMTR